MLSLIGSQYERMKYLLLYSASFVIDSDKVCLIGAILLLK